MAIKNSEYNIKNASGGFDTYHFQTNAKMVKVLDGQKREIGTVEEVLINGKTLSGSQTIASLQTSGIYKGTFTDIPQGVTNPVVVNFKKYTDVNGSGKHYFDVEVTDLRGNTYRKQGASVVGGTWSTSGNTMQESLNKLNNGLGAVENLRTVNKNVVQAINELVSTTTTQSNKIKTLEDANQDDRYVQLSSDNNLSGTINLVSEKGVNVRYGSDIQNLIKARNNKNVVVGNGQGALELVGRGALTYNNGTVWHSNNDGQGSGLDADLVRGVSGDKYARKDVGQTFVGNQTFETTTVQNRLNVGSVSVADSNGLLITQGGKNRFELNTTNNTLVVHNNGGVTLKDTGGRGFTQKINGSGDYVVVNDSNGTTSITIRKSDSLFASAKEIEIQGRKLYLQGTQPTGNNHPVGSIWIS